MSARKLSYPLKYEHSLDVPDSLRSRRLEVWAQERTGAGEGDTQEETEGGGVPSPLASPSRAHVLSCAHYFGAKNAFF